ncbi:hypothetical protein GCM10017673_43640 [Streptosporangium violaceochromogenes]|nr:hypothetical protein GCM10017673_43640 [Streptosporangium violaceochromogenes]
MDFWKTVFGLVRRRAIGPPVGALALVVAALVFLLMPTYYVSTASMVLTTPATGGTLSADPTKPIGLTNPLLQFSDGLRVTAGILILSMNTTDVMAELGVEKSGITKVTINDGRTNPDLLGISTNGPFVYVEVEGRSAETVRDVVARAKERIRGELTGRQQALRAPRSTFITIVDVVPSSIPEAKMSGKLMAAGGAFLLVVLVGLGVAYVVTGRRAGGERPGEHAGHAEPYGHADAGDLGGPGDPDDSGKPDDTVAPARARGEGSGATGGGSAPSAEGPFHDDQAELVVVLEGDEEDAGDRAADTIVFTRSGGPEDRAE